MSAGRTAALVIVAAMLPAVGCLSYGEPCVHAEAVWEQPSLYEGVNASGAANGWQFGDADGWEVTVEHPEGLAFQNDTLDEEWGPGTYKLDRVGWRAGTPVEGRGGDLTVSISAQKEITTLAREDVPEEAIREAFIAFADNLTTEDDETLEAWSDEFLDSRTQAHEARPTSEGGLLAAYRYHLQVSTQVQASERYEDLGPQVPQTSPPSGDERRIRIGGASTGAANWSFVFQFPTIVAEHTDRDGVGVEELKLDALDRVEARLLFDGPEQAHNRSVPMIQTSFEELGWPEPTVSEEDVVRGAIC